MYSQLPGSGWTPRVLLALLTVMGSGPCNSAEGTQEHKRVLILYSFEKEIATFGDFDRALRDKLNSSRTSRIDYYTEYLDLARFPNALHEKALVDSLAEKYSDMNIDLVVPVNLPAVEFTRKYEERLFGAAPIVFSVMDRHWVNLFPRTSNVTGLVEANGITPTLHAALTLLPNTQRVVLISGTLPYEKDWNVEIRKEMRAFEGKVEIISLTALPMADVLRKLASLPRHSIVLYMMMWRDSAGEYFLPKESLSLFSSASSAPIFGGFDEYLGMGIVGGDLVDFGRAGSRCGELCLRVFGGAKPAEIPIQYEDDASYRFDWRQLRRWHIRESRLPAGSVVLFREPSLWKLYKWQIVGTVFLIIFQTLLIGFLLVQRSRLRRSEQKVRKSEERFTLFMDNSPAVTFMKDEQGHYVYMNEAYQKHLNIRREDRQGKTDFEIYPLAIAEEYRKNDQAAMAAGHSIAFPEETPGPDGEQLSWLVYKFPFQDASGQVFVAGIGVDLTEHRRLLSIENELEIARHIQMSILPSGTPELKSLRVSAAYRPMTAVAGDFYDFVLVDAHRAGFLVADASGHGVPAALIAAMIKVAMQSVAVSAQDPAEVLRVLNNILSSQLHGQLITAAFLWVDTQIGKALYSAAGHPPLLRWHGNKLERIESNGMVIGIMPDSEYPVREMPLNSGDRFLLYTDGILEASNSAGEFFGERMLEEVVRKNQLLPPFELSEQVLSEIRHWQPASMTQQDDITLIIIDVV